MNDLEWTIVRGVRVLPIESDIRSCSHGHVNCYFLEGNSLCNGVGHGTGTPCRSFGRHMMFITEEQLPAYLAERLVEGT